VECPAPGYGRPEADASAQRDEAQATDGAYIGSGHSVRVLFGSSSILPLTATCPPALSIHMTGRRGIGRASEARFVWGVRRGWSGEVRSMLCSCASRRRACGRRAPRPRDDEATRFWGGHSCGGHRSVRAVISRRVRASRSRALERAASGRVADGARADTRRKPACLRANIDERGPGRVPWTSSGTMRVPARALCERERVGVEREDDAAFPPLPFCAIGTHAYSAIPLRVSAASTITRDCTEGARGRDVRGRAVSSRRHRADRAPPSPTRVKVAVHTSRLR